MLEAERRSTRSHYPKNLFWKRFWTCLQTEDLMMSVEVSLTYDKPVYNFKKFFKLCSINMNFLFVNTL